MVYNWKKPLAPGKTIHFEDDTSFNNFITENAN